MLRNIYYVLRILLMGGAVIASLYYAITARAYADGLLGFGTSLEVLVVPIIGVPEFDYFFNMICWFFLIGLMAHLLFRIILRS